MMQSLVIWVLFYVGTLCMIASALINGDDQLSFDFYDQLRNSSASDPFNIASVIPIVNSTNHAGRNLHWIEVHKNDGDTSSSTSRNRIDGHESLLLCHVPMFFRYTTDVNSQRTLCPVAYASSSGALLAIHHFNSGDGSVVDELEGINQKCPIRLTAEIVDTQSSPITATTNIAHMLTRDFDSVALPQPCAVFGSQISLVTSRMAAILSVFDLFQVSSAAMSSEFEDPKQYPLFARTHTDVAGFGEMSMSYFVNNLEIDQFALLVPDDSYGLSFEVSVLDSVARHRQDGFEVEVVTSAYLASIVDELNFETEIRRALQVIKESEYNYVLAAFYPEFLEPIMRIAAEIGIAGSQSGKFWLLSGTSDTAPFLLSGQFKLDQGSLAADAIQGSGLIFCRGGLPGVGKSYDRFNSEWKLLGENVAALNFLDAKQPKYADGSPICSGTQSFFEPLPHHDVTFTYDAIVALALSACKALEESSTEERDIFSGQEHRDVFARKTSEFHGASGNVTLRSDFPTRTAESSYFVMVNLQIYDIPESNGVQIYFKGSPISQYFNTESSLWNQHGNATFIYSDGSTIPPSISKPHDNDMHRSNSISSLEVIAIVFISVAVIGVVITVSIFRKKLKQADSMWQIKSHELIFDNPPTVLGRGTYGLVLLAQYRGTKVAVKKVIPSNTRCKSRSKSLSNNQDISRDSCVITAESFKHDDNYSLTERQDEKSSHITRENLVSRNFGGTINRKNDRVSIKSNLSLIMSGFLTTFKLKNRGQKVASSSRLKVDFILEMRTLSKLRHPCITTVMGAVVDPGYETMLIMEYMDHGSLYDMLHNKTMAFDGDILLSLLRDICQGVLFLHMANPKVIHGDLKAANVLVDSRFRAKVSDFGLSQKRKLEACGTPYWMAPELLQGITSNSDCTDVYSFGIFLYEVYSRSDPYEGEDFDEVIKRVKDPNMYYRPQAPITCPSEIVLLMNDCLRTYPLSRPTFLQINDRLEQMDAIMIEPKTPCDERRSSGFFENSHDITRKLLYNVFPRHVAEVLRSGRKVEPEYRDIVTIFFSDIVGFTAMSASLSPLKVSNMLDRLYEKLDKLSHKHNIFKVETIGDAYMAVTNLVENQQNDHAKRIAEFSIEAIHAAKATAIDIDDIEKGFVEIRVGFHSGPVVANVVGSRSPRYCLFGDTVNTASRMESYSAPCRIHCSDRAAAFLNEQCPEIMLTSRGEIDVKGKGSMKTFWVNEKSCLI